MREISYYSQARSEVSAFLPDNIERILDIGCGQGAFLKLAKEKTGAETWGIELVSGITEKNLVDNILNGRVEDLINSIPDNYFDCITFNDILEHLIQPGDVLRMMKAKLTENGIIIASIPNVRFYHNLYELLVKKDWGCRSLSNFNTTRVRILLKPV